MRDKIALMVLLFTLPSLASNKRITVAAEVEMIGGHVMKPSVDVKEDEWATIDLGGPGIKLRAHTQGAKKVKLEYQLFLQNGPNHKDWKPAQVVANWSERREAPVEVDKDSRVIRLMLTPTLIQTN